MAMPKFSLAMLSKWRITLAKNTVVIFQNGRRRVCVTRILTNDQNLICRKVYRSND